MQKRDFTYLSVELHELGGETKLYVRQYSPAYSGTTGFERGHKPGGGGKTRELCAAYWRAVSEKLETASKSTDLGLWQQQAIEIRELSVKISDDLLDEETLNFIFRAARETEILVVITNLIEVPWEALVNPREMNGAFLSQHCIVSRTFIPKDLHSRTFARNNPSIGTGLFVDAVLLREWSNVQNINHHNFKKLSRQQAPIAKQNVDEFFGAMEGKKIILT